MDALISEISNNIYLYKDLGKKLKLKL